MTGHFVKEKFYFNNNRDRSCSNFSVDFSFRQYQYLFPEGNAKTVDLSGRSDGHVLWVGLARLSGCQLSAFSNQSESLSIF